MNNTETIVITGASSGFGKAISHRFLIEGYNVVAIARRADNLNELSKTFPGRVLPVIADITDKKSVEEALKGIPKEFGYICGLVNNAGLSLGFGPAQDNDFSDWEAMINTNIIGLLHITKILIEKFISQNRGHIINIGSVAANYPYMGSNVYGASKSFVHNFSLNLKTDLEGTNIRVSCIAPGLSKTEFALVRFKGDVKKADALYENKTYLTSENIAEMVFWTYSLPSNINVNILEVMPTGQSFALGFNK
ncbi:SDR family NAD(P)-dependent oxidoreductase [Dickeya oryzae]|uniref:SDR family NAD(P)-dependent oxidoreductase n=1 Tax=Dickeya oryzae TaxID=1240404 RepID=A0AB39IX66_9GAMM|nr:SDR family NAD(P)-dependent oxidoreductase [Dickeya oryzae]MBP2858795.1 SDR family NAD(P)-dependent oxidoreductase [Dickeya oryzae]MCA6992142.1 SDR family NAD(P)-dependent oxidoreductase [Dickeya oryzae]